MDICYIYIMAYMYVCQQHLYWHTCMYYMYVCHTSIPGPHTCMYVCPASILACIYVCMSAHIYTGIHTCMYVNNIYTGVRICMSPINTGIHLCMYVYLYWPNICMVYVCVCMPYTWLGACLYMYTHLFIYTGIYVHWHTKPFYIIQSGQGTYGHSQYFKTYV